VDTLSRQNAYVGHISGRPPTRRWLVLLVLVPLLGMVGVTNALLLASSGGGRWDPAPPARWTVGIGGDLAGLARSPLDAISAATGTVERAAGQISATAAPGVRAASVALANNTLAASLVPNPPAQAPDGLKKTVDMVVGWIKWGGLVAGVCGLMFCGIQMAIGRRQRHALSAEGAAGVPWVFAGLSLIAIAPMLVSAFLK